MVRKKRRDLNPSRPIRELRFSRRTGTSSNSLVRHRRLPAIYSSRDSTHIRGETVMRRWTFVAFGLVGAAASAACGQQAGALQAAADTLKVADVKTIEYSGPGKWYQFGQAPNPRLPWPPFDVSAYTASINYETPAARIQMTRKQVVEPDRVRPAPVEQKVDQYISGTAAWNMAAAGGGAPATAPAPQPQPAGVEERTMEIWSTPHGFVKAALANNATSQAAGGGAEVTFTAGRNK